MKRIYFLCLTAIFMAVAGTGHAEEETEPIVIDLKELSESIDKTTESGWKYEPGYKAISITKGGYYKITDSGQGSSPSYTDSDQGSSPSYTDSDQGSSPSYQVRVAVKAENVSIMLDDVTLTGTDKEAAFRVDYTNAKLILNGDNTFTTASTTTNNEDGTSTTSVTEVLTKQLEVKENKSLTISRATENYSSLKIKGNLEGPGSVKIESGVISMENLTNANTEIAGDVLLIATGTIADGVTRTKGIVFVGEEATVYGEVTLPCNLEIKEGYTLTVLEGSILTVPEDDVELLNDGGNIVNNGTVTGSIQGLELEGTPAIISEPANSTSTDVYYGDQVKVDISGLKIKNVTGIAVDPEDFEYEWTGKGTSGNAAAYTVVGGDVGDKIKVAITSEYYNVKAESPLTSSEVTVKPKPVHITAITVPTKVYDGTTTVKEKITFATNDFLEADKDGVDFDETYEITFTSAHASDAAGITVTRLPGLTGASKNYYAAPTVSAEVVAAATAEITKAPLEIKPKDAERVYGSTQNPVFELEYEGFVNDEDASKLDHKYTVEVDESEVKLGPTSEAGSKFKLVVKSSGDAEETNYNVTTPIATLTITQTELSVIAENKEKGYGTPNPALTVKYAGFVNGDTPEKIGLTSDIVTLATSATEKSPVIEKYPIYFANQEAIDAFNPTNYKVTFVPGILTVKPAPQSINKLNNPGEAYEWPAAISGTWRLPLETSEKVPIVYTIEPSGAARITDDLLIPQKSGTFTLTVTVKSNPNYEAISEEHLISVTTPPQPPTLREVIIPTVPGAVTSPPAGIHYAVSGSDYTFRISPEAGREFTGTPVVNALPNISNVRVTANGNGSYTVVIPGVSRPVELSIAAPVTPSTGNAVLPDEQIWGVGGQLHIRVSVAGEAQIYGISGVRVKTVRCAAGETVTEVPAGIYLVRLHGKSWKVAVTD